MEIFVSNVFSLQENFTSAPMGRYSQRKKIFMLILNLLIAMSLCDRFNVHLVSNRTEKLISYTEEINKEKHSHVGIR